MYCIYIRSIYVSITITVRTLLECTRPLQVDKEGAEVQRVQNELMTYDLLPEEFGGDTQVALVSAKEKTGLDELLEKILLQSEVLELKSNPNRAAEGVVVEAQMQRGLGEL